MKRKRNNNKSEQVKFGESSSSNNPKNRRRKMNLNNSLRTVEMSIGKGLLQQLIEQNSILFGFSANEDVKVNLELPETVPMKVKFRKEQEVEVIEHTHHG